MSSLDVHFESVWFVSVRKPLYCFTCYLVTVPGYKLFGSDVLGEVLDVCEFFWSYLFVGGWRNLKLVKHFIRKENDNGCW